MRCNPISTHTLSADAEGGNVGSPAPVALLWTVVRELAGPAVPLD